jgi:uncharacterized protein YbcI
MLESNDSFAESSPSLCPAMASLREMEMEYPLEVDSEEPLGGGQLLAAISSQTVSILREHYGRGPMKAKTYVIDDLVVVVMRGSGFTPLEKTIMDSGNPDRVVDMRHDFQRVMKSLFISTIEDLTHRRVVAFLSQAHVDPDITMEIFFVDGPLEGFGPLEMIDPGVPSETNLCG